MGCGFRGFFNARFSSHYHIVRKVLLMKASISWDSKIEKKMPNSELFYYTKDCLGLRDIRVFLACICSVNQGSNCEKSAVN